MKKLTKIQKKQIQQLEKAWEATGPVDLKIITLFIYAIVNNRFTELIERIENKESFEQIADYYFNNKENASGD